VILEADSAPEEYRFYVRQGGHREFLGSARTKYLSSEVAGGFTGVVMALYAIDGEGRWAEFKNLTWEQRVPE
jgi:alpha-N-arabinofuranosidase